MEVQQIAPHLWHWATDHPEWKPEDRGESGLGWDQVISSYALVADEALVLIDPQVPADEAEAERFWAALDSDVEAHGAPAIVITMYWHVRSAPQIAERYPGTSIWAPAGSAEEVAERVRYTDTYSTGDELPGGIRAFELPRLGETALYLPAHKALAFGDAVLDGPRLCPDGWLPEGMTRDDLADAIRPLLEQDVDLLLLTHGGPTDPSGLEV